MGKIKTAGDQGHGDHGKIKYSTPTIVDLGELARGYGAGCVPGSAPNSPCLAGSELGTGGDCAQGIVAAGNCNHGANPN